MNWSSPNSIMQPRQTQKKNKKSDPTSPSRMNTFQPCIIVTFDHFWHHAIKQFSLYLLFKNFTCTCLHCLLLTMRLWLKLVCSDGPTATRGLGFLVSLFRGRIYYIYIPQKYKVIPLTNNIYIYIYIYTRATRPKNVINMKKNSN